MAEVRTAVGLMSGTSLDGVDVALVVTDGETISELGQARTFPYGEEDREVLRQAFRDAATLTDRNARPGILGAAEALVTLRHAEAVEAFLADAGIEAKDVDIVGFHGQTVFHDPARVLTVQIGDGAALAQRLSIPVAWDFRANDMEAGGQGAPLAPVFHRALADAAKLKGPVVFLNLGGVANVTYIAPDGAVIAFDTGPGNGLLDDWTLARRGEPFDRDGRLAASGAPSEELLTRLLDHSYFRLPPPKSLDRQTFSLDSLSNLSDADGAATLLQFSARSVARALEHLPATPREWYSCGGGRHNVELIRAITRLLDGTPVRPIEALGFNGDATEAQAFAYLAVRAADGKPLTFPATTGVAAPLSGGRISTPKRSD